MTPTQRIPNVGGIAQPFGLHQNKETSSSTLPVQAVEYSGIFGNITIYGNERLKMEMAERIHSKSSNDTLP